MDALSATYLDALEAEMLDRWVDGKGIADGNRILDLIRRVRDAEGLSQSRWIEIERLTKELNAYRKVAEEIRPIVAPPAAYAHTGPGLRTNSMQAVRYALLMLDLVLRDVSATINPKSDAPAKEVSA